jgi:UDP-GlcNAc:undecaprenyl-phosphate/decaprenyl-phosphate GlcNAc-1-phosphate transferase
VAGTANLVNLLDLRPGRALKVSLLAAVPLVAGPRPTRTLAAACVGSAAAMLPADLGERRMLGDCGANALGAALGWGVSRSRGRLGRVTALATVVGLTLVSERVSFSQVIAEHPVLDAVDRLGRRPA